MYCVAESICDIVATFRRRPQRLVGTREAVTPLPHLVKPLVPLPCMFESTALRVGVMPLYNTVDSNIFQPVYHVVE